MAIGAGDARIGMCAHPPLAAWLTTIVLMALQAGFTSFGGRPPLEAANQTRLFASSADVLASWAVARFARLFPMYVRLVMLDVSLMAGRA
jgi:hypothetical protein